MAKREISLREVAQLLAAVQQYWFYWAPDMVLKSGTITKSASWLNDLFQSIILK
jgi:hypothetical protein